MSEYLTDKLRRKRSKSPVTDNELVSKMSKYRSFLVFALKQKKKIVSSNNFKATKYKDDWDVCNELYLLLFVLFCVFGSFFLFVLINSQHLAGLSPVTLSRIRHQFQPNLVVITVQSPVCAVTVGSDPAESLSLTLAAPLREQLGRNRSSGNVGSLSVQLYFNRDFSVLTRLWVRWASRKLVCWAPQISFIKQPVCRPIIGDVQALLWRSSNTGKAIIWDTYSKVKLHSWAHRGGSDCSVISGSFTLCEGDFFFFVCFEILETWQTRAAVSCYGFNYCSIIKTNESWWW